MNTELSEMRLRFDDVIKKMTACLAKRPFDVDGTAEVLRRAVDFLKETSGIVLFRPRVKVLLMIKRNAIELVSYANRSGVSGKRLDRLSRYYFAVDYQIRIKTHEAKLNLITRDLKKFVSGKKRRELAENTIFLTQIEEYLEDLKGSIETDLLGELPLNLIETSDSINLKRCKDEKKLKLLQEEVHRLEEKLWLDRNEKHVKETKKEEPKPEFIDELKGFSKTGFSESIAKIGSEYLLAKIYVESPERRRELISSIANKKKQKKILAISMNQMAKELDLVETLLQKADDKENKLAISLSIAKLSDFFGYLRGHISHRNLIDKNTFKRHSNKFDSFLKKIASEAD